MSQEILLVSPQVTQLIKMSEQRIEDAYNLLQPLEPKMKSIIFFPVNDNDRDLEGGTHWSLLVYSKPENTFYSFDSMQNTNSFATLKIIQVLQNILDCHSAQYNIHPSTQQKNSYDCGLYVICNVENIVQHVFERGYGGVGSVDKLHVDCVDQKRNEILNVIRTLGGMI